MKSKFAIIIAATILTFSGLAWAQIAPLRHIPATNAQNQNSNVLAPTIESLQATIVRLKQRISGLETENANLNNRIVQFTTKGGSEVRAYCSDDLNISHSTAGAIQDCTDDGYKCSPVSGLCLRDCNTSDECHPGHLCDTEIHRCVPAPR